MYTKSAFILNEESCDTGLNKNSERLFFIFEIVPLFLQALNLSASDPLVQKLLHNYGVKGFNISTSKPIEMMDNSGNLIDYLLNFLLRNTRPSYFTFIRVCSQTGQHLSNYNDTYGARFSCHLDDTTFNSMWRNSFDIDLLILCGDIETNPGPWRKSAIAKRMLDDKDVDQFHTLSFAPGEGQRPLNLFQDKDAEYLSFPTIYCGERMNTQLLEGNKIHYADLCKWELRNIDRRVANNIPNFF